MDKWIIFGRQYFNDVLTRDHAIDSYDDTKYIEETYDYIRGMSKPAKTIAKYLEQLDLFLAGGPETNPGYGIKIFVKKEVVPGFDNIPRIISPTEDVYRNLSYVIYHAVEKQVYGWTEFIKLVPGHDRA